MDTWRDEISVEIDDNTTNVSCTGTQIRTKAQFLEACEMQEELDGEDWELADKVLVNTWNAQLEGGYPIQMFQFKARFIRANPEPILPVIEPVEIKIGDLPDPRPDLKTSGLLLHITDPHFGFSRDMDTGKLIPYHDRKALSVVLQIAQMIEFDTVVWGGDILDFAEWSDHYVHSPEFYWTTKPAILEAAWWMGQIVKANPDAKHVAMAGNHEERLPRAINKHLPAAYGLQAGDIDTPRDLLSLPSLLGLDKLGIEWFGDYPGQYFINPNLSVEHGTITSKNPGYAAWKTVSEATHSRLYGHGHKRETATKSNGREEITAVCPGGLCRIDGTVPGHDPINQHWTQGVGIVEYSEAGLEDCRIVAIKEGRAKTGYWIESRGELDNIRNDTGWDF